jgi:hypothetical protein
MRAFSTFCAEFPAVPAGPPVRQSGLPSRYGPGTRSVLRACAVGASSARKWPAPGDQALRVVRDDLHQQLGGVHGGRPPPTSRTGIVSFPGLGTSGGRFGATTPSARTFRPLPRRATDRAAAAPTACQAPHPALRAAAARRLDRRRRPHPQRAPRHPRRQPRSAARCTRRCSTARSAPTRGSGPGRRAELHNSTRVTSGATRDAMWIESYPVDIGSSAVSSVPPPAGPSISRRPPSAISRSAIPTNPRPPGSAPPMPSSRTVT